MDHELMFAKALQKVKEIAKLQGNLISKEDVEKEFEELHLDENQMKMVYDYLEQNKIGVDEALNPDDFLTKEDTDYLTMYLEELKELKKYTSGEKEAITMSAMAGDMDAQQQLVQIYLPEVIDMAKLYAGQGVFLEDLIGEGNVALTMGSAMLGCLEHPSEAEGMLGKMMMDAMEALISENLEAQELDEKILEKLNYILEKAGEMAEELGRKVTPDELSQETGMGLDEILEAVRISGDNIDYLEVEK